MYTLDFGFVGGGDRRSEFGGEESPNRKKMHVVSGVKPGEALLTVTERF